MQHTAAAVMHHYGAKVPVESKAANEQESDSSGPEILNLRSVT